MPLYDAVGINCKNGGTTENKQQVSSIWANPLFPELCSVVKKNLEHVFIMLMESVYRTVSF